MATHPRTPNRTQQQRPATRAPHGSPYFPRQIGGWVSERDYQAFHALGGSAWLRNVVGAAVNAAEASGALKLPAKQRSAEKAPVRKLRAVEPLTTLKRARSRR